MRFGIAVKLNLIVLAVVIALGGTIGLFLVVEERELLDHELERRIRLAGIALSADIEQALAEDDAGDLQAVLDRAADLREVAYLIVKTADGDVRAARWTSRNSNDVTEHSFPLHRPIARDGSRKAAELFGPASVASEGEPIGHLAIGVDMRPRNETLRRLVWKTVFAVATNGVAAMVLGIIFVTILLRHSISPLVAGIREVGAGDLSRRVPAGPADEIGEIGTAFNDMADRLSATLVSKRELEETVTRRTAELSAALDESVRSQDALVEREESIRLLLRSTAEAIYGVDRDGICTFCNPASAKLFGYRSEEDFIGKDIHKLIHHTRPDGSPYPADECPFYAVARHGKACHVENEVMWKADGRAVHVECWSYPVVRGREVSGAVITMLDITERLRLERQLLQSQKLEGIGILAGGIAHDFNNLLTPILGYSEMALHSLPEGHPAGRNLAAVIESARRASDITRQILAFSRQQVLDMKVLDLNDVAAGVVKMLRRLIGEDIEIRLDLGAGLPCVKADPSQMQQVLVNLAVNARDAMPRGGILTIRTSKAETGAVPAWGGRDLPEGQYLALSVSDNGIGMDEATRRRIFEPFFTTKEVGRGTGLGLSTVHGIVRQHGGDIAVYSEPGQGTTFRIYLPCAAGSPDEERAGPRPPAPGSGRILLVEDDDSVRGLAAAILAGHGYRVTSVAGGEEALAEARQSAFDLLVSDVIMPGMNGPELSRKIAEIAPGLKVLFISGYPAGSGSLRKLLAGGEHLLHKPFTPAELLDTIHRVMGEPA